MNIIHSLVCGILISIAICIPHSANAIKDGFENIGPSVFADDHVSPSGSWLRPLCLKLLGRGPRTDKSNKEYAGALKNRRDKLNTYLALRAYSYLLSETEFSWDWQISEGRVRIGIEDNAREFNGILLDLAGILALLTDGYVGDNKWQPQYAMTPEHPNPSFRVAVNVRADALKSISTLGPKENAKVIEATLRVTDGPVGEPTVQIFEDAKAFMTMQIDWRTLWSIRVLHG